MGRALNPDRYGDFDRALSMLISAFDIATIHDGDSSFEWKVANLHVATRSKGYDDPDGDLHWIGPAGNTATIISALESAEDAEQDVEAALGFFRVFDPAFLMPADTVELDEELHRRNVAGALLRLKNSFQAAVSKPFVERLLEETMAATDSRVVVEFAFRKMARTRKSMPSLAEVLIELSEASEKISDLAYSRIEFNRLLRRLRAAKEQIVDRVQAEACDMKFEFG